MESFKDGSAITNILQNTYGVYNPVRKDLRIVGALQYVAAEVLVSKLFRRFFGQDKTWMQELYMHGLSLPFIGGGGALMDDGRPVRVSDPYAKQFLHSSRGIVAVFLAQYILTTFNGGGLFHFNFDLKDMLITAGSKLVTRPIASSIESFFPQQMRATVDVLAELFAAQANESILKQTDR